MDEQRKGIFDAMRAEFTVVPYSDGSEITAGAEYALTVVLIDDVLNSTSPTDTISPETIMSA